MTTFNYTILLVVVFAFSLFSVSSSTSETPSLLDDLKSSKVNSITDKEVLKAFNDLNQLELADKEREILINRAAKIINKSAMNQVKHKIRTIIHSTNPNSDSIKYELAIDTDGDKLILNWRQVSDIEAIASIDYFMEKSKYFPQCCIKDLYLKKENHFLIQRIFTKCNIVFYSDSNVTIISPLKCIKASSYGQELIGDFYFSLDKTLNPTDYLGFIPDGRIKDLNIYHPNIKELTTVPSIISEKMKKCNMLNIEGDLNVEEFENFFEVVIVPSKKLVSEEFGFYSCNLFTSTESKKLHENLFQDNFLDELYKENENIFLESIRNAIASKQPAVNVYSSGGSIRWIIHENRIYYKVKRIKSE